MALHVIVGVVGSGGDLNPMLAVASELARRGHECTVLAGEWQETPVRRLGLDFRSILSERQFLQFTANSHAAPDRNWLAFFYDAVFPAVVPTFDHVRDHAAPGRTVLIGANHVIGLRLASERFDLPLLTTNVQPQPVRPDPNHEFSLYFNGLLGRLLDRHRANAGLGGADAPFIEWLDGAHRIASFFPEWFPVDGIDAPLQRQGMMLDFLFDDPQTEASTAADVDAFMARYDRPIVFTAGTGNASVLEFFAAAAQCASELRKPAIFLSKAREQMPDPLPHGILHVDYLPFAGLLPYAGAIVHHGGIGTCAQALRAGIPQLVVPGGFDQFDNAARMMAFGVGDRIAVGDFGHHALASKLERLLGDDDVARRCRDYRDRFDDSHTLQWCCDRIEAAFDR